MYGVFMLDPLEWRLLCGLHSDGENKALPPGVGKDTIQKMVAKDLIEKWTTGSGRYAVTCWRRTSKGDEAVTHDEKLHRAPPAPWRRLK